MVLGEIVRKVVVNDELNSLNIELSKVMWFIFCVLVVMLFNAIVEIANCVSANKQRPI